MNPKQRLLQSLYLQMQSDTFCRIRDTLKETYIYVDIREDVIHEHKVFTASKDCFNEHAFGAKTIFRLHCLGDNKYRIQDQSNDTYLFIGDLKDKEGEYLVLTAKVEHFSKQGWEQKSVFEIEWVGTDKMRVRQVQKNVYMFVSAAKDELGNHLLCANPLDRFQNNGCFQAKTLFERIVT